MEWKWMTPKQKDKIEEMVKAYPHPVCLRKHAAALTRMNLVRRISEKGKQPAEHVLTEFGKRYVRKILKIDLYSDHKEVNINSIPDKGPVCLVCAEAAGATCPKEHLATHWLEECSVCGSYAQVCDVGDYDWPDKQSRGIRD